MTPQEITSNSAMNVDGITGVSRAPRTTFPGAVAWLLIAWLLMLPTRAWTSSYPGIVQKIGNPSGALADAIADAITVVPFSRRTDASTTPIILARPLSKRPHLRPAGGLSRAEQGAVRQAYAAGQTILLLNASTHDIEALHTLLRDGVAYESTTHPVVSAYALRKEYNRPSARILANAHSPISDNVEIDEGALQRAVDVLVSELTNPPVVGDDPSATATDWASSPVQSWTLTSTSNGLYNTPIHLYALHSCDEKMDYYLVNTGGDWTATEAKFQSASKKADSDSIILRPFDGALVVDWSDDRTHCTGGIDISNVPFKFDERICRYANYPHYYEVNIVPPNGPTVVQENAAPAGDQGKSENYSSGFSFSLGGDVNISGAGINAGVSWSNSFDTTVPPLVVDAGDKGNEGTFTKYRYCTVGDTVENCDSSIQMVSDHNICQRWIVGDPQNGQTPNGRLSNVAQTVLWKVDPTTYPTDSSTFDISVTWMMELATSTTRLWWGKFRDPWSQLPIAASGPAGYCTGNGCNCAIQTDTTLVKAKHTFKVPYPSTNCVR